MIRLSFILALAILLIPAIFYVPPPRKMFPLSDSTKVIAARIAAVNELMGSSVSESRYEPEQYRNFLALKRLANKDELIELTHHANGVVRCYSFWALCELTNCDIFPLVLEHISDSEVVQTLFGCLGGRERIGDFFIERAKPKLTDDQKRRLDRELLFKENNLWAKSGAIYRAAPCRRVYNRLRELVINENDQDALVYLAKYQKERDIKLILNNFDEEDNNINTYRAIVNFPDPVFLPLLEKKLHESFSKHHYYNEWPDLYKAISSYKNSKAVELLELPITHMRDSSIKPYALQYLIGVLDGNDSMYDKVLIKARIEKSRCEWCL